MIGVNSSLVVLNSVSGNIWDKGFRGEILYYPILDYSALPHDVLDTLVTEVVTRIDRGIDCVVFCQGGHGRTGYVVACILGMLGDKDPIQTIRAICKDMIESDEQIKSIAEYLKLPELATKYYCDTWVNSYGGYTDYRYGWRSENHDVYRTCKTCGSLFKGVSCTFCGDSVCFKCGKTYKGTSCDCSKTVVKSCMTCEWSEGHAKICEYCTNNICYQPKREEKFICGEDCPFFSLHEGECELEGKIVREGERCFCPKDRKIWANELSRWEEET